MAQLKDLIVTGATRLIGNAYAGTIQITTLNAPTAAGGTTYGPGTNGYVLKSNGSSVYWGPDNNSVTGVKGNAESSYRTGQVNLTPANIGALALTGGIMTGAIKRYYSAASTDPVIAVAANNQDATALWMGHGTAAGNPSGNYYKFLYKGTGSSPNNYFQLVAGVASSSEVVAMQINEQGNVSFTNTVAASISGNADTATKLATARTISLTGSVTGSGSFDGSGNLSIATTTNHNHKTLTVGNKTYNGSSDVTIEIADLGLASTTTFIGLTSTNLSNGSTTNPVTITVGPTTGSVTATNGSVVMEASSGEEYIWAGNKWNLMGLASSWALANHIHGNITNAGTITSDTAKASGQHLVITDSNNKICRSAITLGTATNTYLRNDGSWATPTDTNKYHKTGSWSGLTYTATAVNSADELKFTVPSASTSAAGAVQLSSATNSTSTTLAATASAVKAAYDLAAGKVSRSGDTMTGMLKVKGLKGTSGIDYGEVLPDTAEEGQIFFQLNNQQNELPDGGTTGQFLRGDRTWSNELNGQLYVKNHLVCNTNTPGIAFGENGSGLEIREVGLVGNTQSSWEYAPKIGFHWSGRCALQLGLNELQQLCAYDNSSTTNYAGVRFGKTFLTHDGSYGPNITIINPNIQKGVTPAENHWSNIWFTDQTGNSDYVGNRLGGIELCRSHDDGGNHIYMQVFKPQAMNSDSGTIYLNYIPANNEFQAGARCKFFGAVWNDYAEYRASDEIEAGRCVREVGDGTLIRTTERLQKGCEIVSDTFGFAIGKTEKYNTPTAASGRVLAYLYEDYETAKTHIGDPVCSGPNGTVSIMTEEEEMRYPSRIIGTISEVPNYDIWEAGHNGDHQIKVNGRIWIRIR